MTITPGSVVVGYEATETGLTALAWAAEEALHRAVPLTVIHVFEYHGVVPGPFGTLGHVDSPVEVAVNTTREAVWWVNDRYPDLAVSGSAHISGAVETLVSRSRDALMLVVGTHGPRHAATSLLGSVASQCAFRAHCPVVTVPDQAQVAPAGPVLVGTDGSPLALDAVRFAADEAAARDVPLIVTSAHHRTAPGAGHRSTRTPGPLAAREGAVALSGDAAAAAHLRIPGLEVRVRAVEGEPARGLRAEITSTGASMLVIGAHGRGGFPALVGGSVAHNLIRAAPIPLAVIHAASGTPRTAAPVLAQDSLLHGLTTERT